MKVSAYAGTQRTQLHEQELLFMTQETIVFLSKERIVGVPAEPKFLLGVAKARLDNSG